MLVESARIARCAPRPLSDLTTEAAEAVLFPGGFGAAKNLSTFGFQGAEMTVNPEVERVLQEFHAAGKPVALCCIAPILAAKVVSDISDSFPNLPHGVLSIPKSSDSSPRSAEHDRELNIVGCPQ